MDVLADFGEWLWGYKEEGLVKYDHEVLNPHLLSTNI